MGVVKLRGIKKSYRLGEQTVHALRGVDLDLESGELTALMGPSGSGKTSLLNILGCLDVPTEGTYELGGRTIGGGDFNTLAGIRSREIGFIFQNFNLIPVLSVLENVELSMVCAKKLGPRERRERAEQVVGSVGLSKFAHHRPDQLSGGQQQRVAIARALAPQPRLILADEPTANLDSDTASAILALLVALNQDAQVTILLSTHDPRILSSIRRKIFMRDGLLVDDVRGDAAPAHAEERLPLP